MERISFKDITYEQLGRSAFKVFIYGFVYDINAQTITEAKHKAFRKYRKDYRKEE